MAMAKTIRNILFIKNSILDSINVTVALSESAENDNICNVPDYNHTYVSNQILKIVMGYTGYVNRSIWHKLQ